MLKWLSSTKVWHTFLNVCFGCSEGSSHCKDSSSQPSRSFLISADQSIVYSLGRPAAILPAPSKLIHWYVIGIRLLVEVPVPENRFCTFTSVSTAHAQQDWCHSVWLHTHVHDDIIVINDGIILYSWLNLMSLYLRCLQEINLILRLRLIDSPQWG